MCSILPKNATKCTLNATLLRNYTQSSPATVTGGQAEKRRRKT